MYFGDLIAIGILIMVGSFIVGYIYGAWRHLKD